MGRQVIVIGKGEATFEDWINKEYTIDELISKNIYVQKALILATLSHSNKIKN